MPDTSDSSVTIETESLTSLQWRSWPVRDNAVRSSLVGAGLLFVAVVVYALTGRLPMMFLALAAMGAALWRFFLPVEFELSDRGIDQRVFRWQRHIPWGAIRRYEICAAGILLLPEVDGSLSPLRGLYLPWTSHRDEVVLRVRYRVDPQQDDSAVEKTQKA